MSDPFDTHTHGRFYGVAPCQSCKAKDAEIERLRAVLRDIYTWNTTGDYERDLFRMKDWAIAALEDK